MSKQCFRVQQIHQIGSVHSHKADGGKKAVTYMTQKVAVLHNYGVQISSACMPKCHVCMKFEGLEPHGAVLVKVHK